MDVQVGQIYRDTYYDGHNAEMMKRTIKVIQVLPNGAACEVLTDVRGAKPKRPRRTTLMFKTLTAGYEYVATENSTPAADEAEAV